MTLNGALDIAQVFDNYRASGPPYILDFVMLFKVMPDPLLVGQTAHLRLRITGGDHPVEFEDEFDYTHPSLKEWADGTTGFLRMPIQMELSSPGEYLIEVLEDQKQLAAEFLKLVDSKEVSDAGFRGTER